MTALARILPAEVFDIRRPQRMVERSAMVWRRSYMVVVSGVFEPLFYLLSIRIGLSELVGQVEVDGRLIDYDRFVAPGLMAAAAMNGAIFDSTMNIFHKWKAAKLYDAVLATPMSAGDVALGEISWAVLRGLLYSSAFLVAMLGLGMVETAWIVLALPACVLVGFTFSAIGMACTTYMRNWSDFEYVPALTLPIFLFSATLYPASAYGDWRWAVNLSPLYHGVELVRAANIGEWSADLIAHALVLVALALIGLAVTTKRMAKLLLT